MQETRVQAVPGFRYQWFKVPTVGLSSLASELKKPDPLILRLAPCKFLALIYNI